MGIFDKIFKPNVKKQEAPNVEKLEAKKNGTRQEGQGIINCLLTPCSHVDTIK